MKASHVLLLLTLLAGSYFSVEWMLSSNKPFPVIEKQLPSKYKLDLSYTLNDTENPAFVDVFRNE